MPRGGTSGRQSVDLSASRGLQLANYLTRHGTGLVGVLLTRAGIDSTAQWVSREQWVLHDKLIIWLSDDDINAIATQAAAPQIGMGEASGAHLMHGLGKSCTQGYIAGTNAVKESA